MITVDFNMRDDAGRVPALLDRDIVPTLHVGDEVQVSDLEGNRCNAKVEAIDPLTPAAYLSLIPDTTVVSERTRWIVENTQEELLAL